MKSRSGIKILSRHCYWIKCIQAELKNNSHGIANLNRSSSGESRGGGKN